MTAREAMAAAVDRLTRLGIEPMSMRVEGGYQRLVLTITFATPDDLARYAADDRAMVEVIDRRIPLRHIQHSALYDRGDLQVLLVARVWEWELSDEAVTA